MHKPSFRPAAALAVLEDCMDDISAFEPIVEGGESQAYRFQSGTRSFVMRINPWQEGFEKDAFAYRRFARPGLPIPEVIKIGQIDGHFFCVSEYIPGVTLQDLPASDLMPLLVPTARTLEVIGSTNLKDMSGFGPFDGRGVGGNHSWRDFLISIADPHRYEWVALQGSTPRKT
jgi:hygromycin-B 4-O-kinase